MEYTELADYPLPGGTITTWTPVVDETAWIDDQRELSYDHENHLATAHDGAWIGAVMFVPMPFSAGLVRRTLRAWMSRHEVLRTTVTASSDDRGGWRRRTCGSDAVDVRAQESVVVDRAAAHDTIDAAFRQVGPRTWPHVVFASLQAAEEEGAGSEPRPDGFHLAFGADHAVMDAYSQLLWFGEIVDLYRRALCGDSDRELGRIDVGSHVDFAAFERRLGQLVSAQGEAVRTWEAFLGGAGDRARFPTFPDADLAQRPPGQAERFQSSASTVLLGPDRTEDVSAWARSAGFGLQSAAFGAVARATQRVGEVDVIRLAQPTHTRHEACYAGSVGWYVGIAPLTIDLSGVSTTALAVEAADRALAAVRHLASTPFPRISSLLGVTDGPRFVVSYVDVRHTPGAPHWQEWSGRTLRAAAPDADEVYLWVVRSSEGMNLSARWPSGQRARRAMDRFVDALVDELEHMAHLVSAHDTGRIGA